VVRLSALIDDVLDLTQSDSGSLLLAEEQVDLDHLCSEAVAAALEGAERKSIELALEIDPSVGAVTGDRSRLRQALDHILKNAVAYTDEGGRILIHADGDAVEAQITISDNGRGIAPVDRDRIFDRFQRTVTPRSGEEGALGLGLPLARQFVEAHGGRLELESELEHGTTVTLRLPRLG
jgi:signal transduction histidine kinase